MTAIVYVIFSKVYRAIADERLRPIQKRFVLDEAHRYITGPAFSHVRWQCWPLIAEAYARLKQPDKAGEVLAQMAGVEKGEAWGKAKERTRRATPTIKSSSGKLPPRSLRSTSASSMP